MTKNKPLKKEKSVKGSGSGSGKEESDKKPVEKNTVKEGNPASAPAIQQPAKQPVQQPQWSEWIWDEREKFYYRAKKVKDGSSSPYPFNLPISPFAIQVLRPSHDPTFSNSY